MGYLKKVSDGWRVMGKFVDDFGEHWIDTFFGIPSFKTEGDAIEFANKYDIGIYENEVE